MARWLRSRTSAIRNRGNIQMRNNPNKRSVVIDGKPTSFNLEQEFYDELLRIAHNSQYKTLSSFVGNIMALESKFTKVSQHLRIVVLRHLQNRLETFETRPLAIGEPND